MWYVQTTDLSIDDGSNVCHIVGPFDNQSEADQWIEENGDVIKEANLEANSYEIMSPDEAAADIIEIART